MFSLLQLWGSFFSSTRTQYSFLPGDLLLIAPSHTSLHRLVNLTSSFRSQHEHLSQTKWGSSVPLSAPVTIPSQHCSWFLLLYFSLQQQYLIYVLPSSKRAGKMLSFAYCILRDYHQVSHIVDTQFLWLIHLLRFRDISFSPRSHS